MSTKDQLKLYKKALKDYKAGLKMDRVEKIIQDLSFGFCNYFFRAHGINLMRNFDKRLPILYSLRSFLSDSLFWFPAGDLEPRIELLEKAIQICKEELKKEVTDRNS